MPFFNVKQRSDGRWLLYDNHDKPFYSIGLNHLDETSLLHPDGKAIHSAKYPSRQEFIAKTVARFRSWNINTIGWTQEWITNATDMRGAPDWGNEVVHVLHGDSWTQQELLDCGMPYIVQIPVMNFQDWNGNPDYVDPDSKFYSDWCTYLARSICTTHRDSELCIGYYFVDIPSWGRHATGKDFPTLAKLSQPVRDSYIATWARDYYRILVTAIKAVDPNHLVLGDRFNGNRCQPAGVIEAASEFIDLLFVQYFHSGHQPTDYQSMVADLHEMYTRSGKPVLVADIGNWCATKHNPGRQSNLSSQAERGKDYTCVAKALMAQPWCLGWHWCGYIESIGARGWGVVDPLDEEYEEMTREMREANLAAQKHAVT